MFTPFKAIYFHHHGRRLHGLGHAWSVPSFWRACWFLWLHYSSFMFHRLFELIRPDFLLSRNLSITVFYETQFPSHYWTPIPDTMVNLLPIKVKAVPVTGRSGL
jgi:hypothetical protein